MTRSIFGPFQHFLAPFGWRPLFGFIMPKKFVPLVHSKVISLTLVSKVINSLIFCKKIMNSLPNQSETKVLISAPKFGLEVGMSNCLKQCIYFLQSRSNVGYV